MIQKPYLTHAPRRALFGAHEKEARGNPHVARAMDAVADAAAYAMADPMRPAFHFLPPAQWMNDPNGTFHHNGWNHLFYQHNPFSDTWANLHWGHARSRDLVHWEHLPIALWPSEELGENHCYSGCAWIDAAGRPMLFYTSIGPDSRPREAPHQCAALGDEEWAIWSKHPANPILTDDVHGGLDICEWRDPFIFEEAGRTFMILGARLGAGDDAKTVVPLYEARNADLTQWEYRNFLYVRDDRQRRSVECPNFVRVGARWILLFGPYCPIVSPINPVHYAIGDFDVENCAFRAETQGLLDHSDQFYATNTMIDSHGRCIVFGWIRGWPEGRGWSGCLGLPRVVEIDERRNLLQRPVPELRALRARHRRVENLTLSTRPLRVEGVRGNQLEIQAHIRPDAAECAGIRFVGVEEERILFEVQFSEFGKMMEVAGKRFPHTLDPIRPVHLHVFYDRSLLEVFVDEMAVCTRILDTGGADARLELMSDGGEATLISLDAWNLKSIW